jgi:GT2 family glycosyltransferase
MNKPKVVVLILSYNGKELLDDSVSSYLNNEYSNFQIVVIDNGSTDGTMEYVEKKWPDVFVLRTQKNLKYSGGFNLGLSYAFNKINADYVLITNNDVKADRNVIQKLVDVSVSDPLVGFVTGKVYFFEMPNILQTVGKYEDAIGWNGKHMGGYIEDTGQYDEIAERVFIDDIFKLVSSKVYYAVGGYDTTFRIQAEEFDWQARAKKQGFRILYTPHAKIWHKDSMTIGKDSSSKAYYDARNPMLVILKHKDPVFFRRYFWYHLKTGVTRTSLLKIKQLRFKSSIAVWAGFISGIIWGVRNRKLTLNHFL